MGDPGWYPTIGVLTLYKKAACQRERLENDWLHEATKHTKMFNDCLS